MRGKIGPDARTPGFEHHGIGTKEKGGLAFGGAGTAQHLRVKTVQLAPGELEHGVASIE